MEFSKDVFAARLRAKRAEADLSQELLAEMAGVGADTVVKYEGGLRVPGSDTLMKLAEALGCSPDHLLGWPDVA
ncbi:MAG: helix-turn-helix transcriptional regulator [Raoultibacter sp.]